MWARVHKIDRIKPLANGGAYIFIDDERNAVAMGRVPGLSTNIAIARVLNARRLLDVKYAGKGEVRYCSLAPLPTFLFEAVSRAGAAICDRSGDTVILPPAPAGVSSTIDTAFSDLAHYTRSNASAADWSAALKRLETDRRKQPLDKDVDPVRYWTSVFELAALAGELWRPRGGRWIETQDTPVPFAVKFTEGTDVARPAKLAIRIVEGDEVEETMATESMDPAATSK